MARMAWVVGTHHRAFAGARLAPSRIGPSGRDGRHTTGRARRCLNNVQSSMTTALADTASSPIRSTPSRAAIYTRISADPDGLRAGVERQRADCLALARARRLRSRRHLWRTNDRSAHSGKPRPAFERPLADAADGVFDAVIVWASDQLYRLMKDFIRITAELAPHARITVVGGGEVDLTTAESIMRRRRKGWAASSRPGGSPSGRQRRQCNAAWCAAGSPRHGDRSAGGGVSRARPVSAASTPVPIWTTSRAAGARSGRRRRAGSKAGRKVSRMSYIA